MKKLAILIPVYNDQEGLDKTIKSLLKQTINEFDIIVVDDGSTPEIENSFISQKRVKIIKMLENSGIERAMNTGLKYIIDKDYQYIGRIDAGDLAVNDRFEKQLEFMERNEKFMLVGSHVQHIDMDGEKNFLWKVPINEKDIKKKMHINSCFPHPSVVYRTEAVKKIGLYSTKYKAAEDYEFFYRFIDKYRVSNLDETLTIKELNPNSISIKKRRTQLLSRLRIQLKYFNFLYVESYIGIFQLLIMLIVPNRIVIKIKNLLTDK